LDVDGNYTYCRYYPSAVQIAAVANNMDEQFARARVLAQYPNHKLLGMAKFAQQYGAAIRSGSGLDAIGQPPRSTDLVPSSAKVLAHVA
jgi:hypothetical protein